MNDFQIDLGDLMPGFTAAVSEAMCDDEDEARICPECDGWKNSVDKHCDDCQNELDQELADEC